MVIAAATLVGFAVLTGHARAVLATAHDHPVLAVLIGCGTAAYQALYFASVLTVGVSVATVVSLGLAPVLAAAWEHLRAHTRPSARQLLVLAAALSGLVVISATAQHGTASVPTRPGLGLVLAVAAGATYAAATMLGHTLAQRVDPVALTTCATTVGAVALAPFLVVAVAVGQPALPTSGTSLALLVYLGVATMALSYGLLYAGLRTTSGSAATIATLVEPISAAALAVVLLGERLPWPAVVGAALILGAVVALRPTEDTPAPI